MRIVSVDIEPVTVIVGSPVDSTCADAMVAGVPFFVQVVLPRVRLNTLCVPAVSESNGIRRYHFDPPALDNLALTKFG